MRIIIDMWHPADVHFFKHFIWDFEKKGHEVLITSREKDVTTSLLRGYGFKYKVMSRKTGGLVGLAIELLQHDIRLFNFTRKYRPDILIAFGGQSIAHVGPLLKIPSISFYDSDFATLIKLASYPFLTKICTPSSYRKNLGKKHIKFDSYKELAYLHPEHYKPNKKIIEKLNIKKNEKYFLIRLISFDASHDVGLHGISIQAKRKLISILNEHGKVFISSEELNIPDDFKKYLLKINPIDFPDVLSFSSLVISEGTTTATEAGILGIPTIYINDYTSGNMDEEIQKYGIMKHIIDDKLLLTTVTKMLANKNLSKERVGKRKRMLNDKINLSKWMISYVEDYYELMKKRK